LLSELFLIPNLLTLSRILISPAILIWFENLPVLIGIVAFAAFTDFLDGYIARQTNSLSALGAILDPIADKIFVLSFVIAALIHGLLDWWMLTALLMRDLYVTGALPIMLSLFGSQRRNSLKIAARWPGKIVTILQFLSVAFLIFTPLEFWKTPRPLFHWLHLTFFALIPFSLWAMLDYTLYYLRLLRQEPPQPHQEKAPQEPHQADHHQAN
jgi:cardiolipin synthase (CMP-forming)